MKPATRLYLAATVVLAVSTLAACGDDASPPRVALSVTQVRSIQLTGGPVRFDYQALDDDRQRLFIAHMGAGQVIDVDLRTGKVVRTIDAIADAHGVIVVPDRNRVYATATGTNQLVALDEVTGAELGRAPTGTYPDGLAYDPLDHTVWTTNESEGSETVVDATTMNVLDTVKLGDEVGNVVFDPVGRQMLVGVQSDDELAIIDPNRHTVTRRVELPGCDSPHSVAVAAQERIAFVGCEDNATLLTLDMNTWEVTGSNQVGDTPDVLSYDAGNGHLWAAAESGWVTLLVRGGKTLTVIGRDHLADGAHTVAVDLATHHAYLPIPKGPDGQPVLLEEAPTS